MDHILTEPGFLTALTVSVHNRELVAEFDRLKGTDLLQRGAPINVIVDECTGLTDAAFREFADFVYEFIYLPLKELWRG